MIMKKIIRLIKGVVKDFWVVLLDIIAVNAAYYLTLLIRFYVNLTLNPDAVQHVEDFWLFAPYYTVLCIIVFVFFRLYNGMWKYAGMNSLHRIIEANLVTCAIQVLGTLIFINRMPLSYYIIGFCLQLCFIVAIRFSYRVFVVEKRRFKAIKQAPINTIIVGAGELGRRVKKYLEETSVYKPVCIVDSYNTSTGTQLDLIPVINGAEQIEEAVRQYNVKAVFIANPMITPEMRQRIREFCDENQLELQDYTGYLSNIGGVISLTRLLELAQGPLKLRFEQEENIYNDSEEAIKNLSERYHVEDVYAENDMLVIDLIKYQNDGNEAWMEEYKEETGEDVSFF